MLAQIRLMEKKGRRQQRTQKETLDVDALESKGKMGVLREFVMEMVKKHMYEREVNMIKQLKMNIQIFL